MNPVFKNPLLGATKNLLIDWQKKLLTVQRIISLVWVYCLRLILLIVMKLTQKIKLKMQTQQQLVMDVAIARHVKHAIIANIATTEENAVYANN